MTWSELSKAKKVRTHATSKSELDGLRAIIARDLADSEIHLLSEDRRFATAYNAALQACTMAIACAGYRVVGVGHHQTTFASIVLAMGDEVLPYASLFEVCRRTRNQLDYDFAGVASQTETEQLILETKSFVALVEEWIRVNHPALASP